MPERLVIRSVGEPMDTPSREYRSPLNSMRLLCFGVHVFLTSTLLFGRSLLAQPASFSDGFERDRGWYLYEELVGGSACYGTGIGSIGLSQDRAYSGRQSLLLWANKAASSKSNHVIAVNRLGNTGRKGKWTYSVHVFVDAQSEQYQTGPEISVQNTRLMPAGVFRTFTAAVQYQKGHDADRAGTWAVWREKSPGHAGWVPLFDFRLDPGKWYRLVLSIDYDNNRYGWFTVQSDDERKSLDLSDLPIAGESRLSEEGFAITLEGENLWNNCGQAGNFSQAFYYDDVSLTPTANPAAIGITPSSGRELSQRFRLHYRAGSEQQPLSVVNVLINRSLDPKSACHVAYSLNSGTVHLMNDRGDATLQTMRINSANSMAGPTCDVDAASANFVGTDLLLDLTLTFHLESFAGNHTIFMAARDAQGGNSGWVAAGAWRIGAKPSTPAH